MLLGLVLLGHRGSRQPGAHWQGDIPEGPLALGSSASPTYGGMMVDDAPGLAHLPDDEPGSSSKPPRGRLVTSLSVSQVISPPASNTTFAEFFTSFQEKKKKKPLLPQ